MAATKHSLKVFLCHAHADRDSVRKLYTRLTQDGVDAWLDKEKLLPGQDWELEIRRAVREADVVVVCLSTQFNQAGFRQKEVRLALDTAMEKPEGEIFIIPARLEECDNLESLRKWHWVDLFEDNGYGMLLRALRARADRIGAVLRIVDEEQSNKTILPENQEVPIIKKQNELEKTPIIRDKKNTSQTDGTKKEKSFVKNNVPSPKPVSIQKQKQVIKRPFIMPIIVVAMSIVVVVWIVSSNRIRAGEIAPTEQATQVTLTGPTDQAATMKSKHYSSAPPMTIDVNKQYFAAVQMVKGGGFVIQLYPDKAPIAVNNFVFLARDGYYDGITFHRVLEGFMAQGGDPTGTGSGGPGYEFVNEDSDLMFDKAGVVAMANLGRGTNGSQFFITFAPTEFLNGDYTIFGQVVSGMDIVNGITRRDPAQNPNFTGDVMENIIITEK